MSQPTVFVVDDDPGVRNASRRLLSSIGLTVQTCRCAKEFLERYDPGVPGCLVLDVRMPGMSGSELQQELVERGESIPIVFVTGHADVAFTVGSMKRGAISILEKPYEPQDLIDVVHEAMRKDAEARLVREQVRDYKERLARLTGRERQVLDLVVCGCTSNQIASRLKISPKTVHAHRGQMMEKMDVGSVAELTRHVVAIEYQAGAENDSRRGDEPGTNGPGG